MSGLNNYMNTFVKALGYTSKRLIEFIIYQSRWLLLPFYIGLVMAQGMYCYQFCIALWELAHHFTHLKDTEIMLVVLGLIDMTLIANLIKMIISGSYQSYVDKIQADDHLEKVSSGALKIKIGGVLVGVSLIHLLQAFINASQVSTREIVVKVVIHLVFVLSTFAMAYIEYLYCKSKSFESKH